MRRSNSVISLVWMVAMAVSLASPAQQQKRQQPTRKRRPPSPALAQIQDEAGLPRVLLLGDSISIGYTLGVRKLLAGKANVHRPAANCASSKHGIEFIDKWLGEGKWDVIHFNWGLHDLKYLGPNGENLADPESPESKQQVPPKQYETNMRALVQRLKKTGAVLVWCATTPVPQGCQGRVPGDSAKYNQIAAKVMQEEGVAINDLFSFAQPRLKEIQRPANVHFTAEGSAELAEEVAKHIEEALAKRGAGQ